MLQKWCWCPTKGCLTHPFRISCYQTRSHRSQALPRGGKPTKITRQFHENKHEQSDDRGWWEKEEERSMEAYMLQPLESWQEETLERAYAVDGRRKMKVQALSQQLDLDRVRVISWAKEFAQKPASEREGILARRKVEIEQERIKNEQKRVAEAAVKTMPHPEDQSGFIPFYTRKDLGMVEGRKRLPADVIRTLESIYTRTPYPSNDVIRGVWELHRLSREVVLEWLSKRRESDGIVASTQRRHQRPRGGSSAVFIEDGQFVHENDSDGDVVKRHAVSNPNSPQIRREVASPASVSENGLQKGLWSAVGEAEEKKTKETFDERTQIVTMSRSEMAALRSSLPSRRKYKGMKLAEKMGIKSEENDGQNAIQIGDVRFVQDSSAVSNISSLHGTTNSKWSKTWRFKQASRSNK